jgi:hypothetical protein
MFCIDEVKAYGLNVENALPVPAAIKINIIDDFLL